MYGLEITFEIFHIKYYSSDQKDSLCSLLFFKSQSLRIFFWYIKNFWRVELKNKAVQKTYRLSRNIFAAGCSWTNIKIEIQPHLIFLVMLGLSSLFIKSNANWKKLPIWFWKKSILIFLKYSGIILRDDCLF